MCAYFCIVDNTVIGTAKIVARADVCIAYNSIKKMCNPVRLCETPTLVILPDGKKTKKKTRKKKRKKI